MDETWRHIVSGTQCGTTKKNMGFTPRCTSGTGSHIALNTPVQVRGPPTSHPRLPVPLILTCPEGSQQQGDKQVSLAPIVS